MCENCGCREGNEKKYFANHTHTHADGTTHTHPGSDSHHHHHHETPAKTVTVQQNILAENDKTAAETRLFLKERGIIAVNMISSPGSGKTMLLEKTLQMLQGKLKCAVITGDQQTDNDAERLKGKGAAVVQIKTKSACHLNAEQVASVLPDIIENDTKLLFIENVGNLVCPAAFDLGENFKIALLSVTEGEDKPAKYPVLFSDAQIVLLTKTDLIPHLDWNKSLCRKYIRDIKPGVFIFELSARSGDGMQEWTEYLAGLTS